MPDGLYERDFLVWSQEQAALLRRLAAGEGVNAAVDWSHLIEEVEDLGKSELHACTSYIRQALIHLIKLRAWPDSQSAPHWRGEVATFLDGLGDRFTPSMRQHIDVSMLYAKALRVARLGADQSGAPRDVPETCPYTLDDLLGDDVTVLWLGPEG